MASVAATPATRSAATSRSTRRASPPLRSTRWRSASSTASPTSRARSAIWGSIPTSRSLARPSSGGGFLSGSNERAIPDAMRAPVGADRLAHEFLIRLVVALEPPDTAVALEDEQVRGHPVEEPQVVAD